MKLTSYLLAAATSLVLLLPPAPASAQPLSFDRVLACGNGDGPNGWGPTAQAFDAQGNQYVAGTFNGTIQLGNTLLKAVQTPANRIRPVDTFLAKLDAAGNYVWAIQFGDNQASAVEALAVDGQGNLYVAGAFESFGLRLGGAAPVVYNSSAFSEAFVAQFSAATGQLRWARRAGGTGRDYGTKLALNAAGEVYLVCQTSSPTVDFGATTLANAYTSTNGTSVLAKLSAGGMWQWARPVGLGENYAVSMQLDAQGGIYLAGLFYNALAFGTVSLTSPPIAGTRNSYGADMFVAKTSDAGGWTWAVQGDATTHQNFVEGVSMTLDGAGYLYVAGSYSYQAVRLGNIILPNLSNHEPYPNPQVPPFPNDYYADAFVSRMNAATGTWEWATRTGGLYDDFAGNPLVGSQGRLYVSLSTGTSTSGTPQLALVDNTNGAWLATQPLPTLGFIGLDRQDRLHLAGSIGITPTTFGTLTLQPAGPTQGTGYLARFGAGPLAARTALGAAGLQVWPNPAGGGAVWVQGPAAGQAVWVLDVLGRVVAQGRMPAAGPLALPLALPAGVYVVQAEGQARRLVIE